MKRITLNVCQGVGDIFWVYQKFAPYFDIIDFNILITDSGDARQSRSLAIIKSLPNVGIVNGKMVTPAVYKEIANNVYPMEEIFQQYEYGQMEFEYCCNRPLEEGTRIEDIDPKYPIEEIVPLPIKEYKLPGGADWSSGYICFYVSGDTRDLVARKNLEIWDLVTWAQLLEGMFLKLKAIYPVAILGASIDTDVVLNMETVLKSRNFDVGHFIDLEPGHLFDLMKKSKYFVGYQSGLSILADNLDIPQLMIYFQSFKKMKYTWAKKKNLEKKIFQAGLFSDTIKEIVDQLPPRFPVWTE